MDGPGANEGPVAADPPTGLNLFAPFVLLRELGLGRPDAETRGVQCPVIPSSLGDEFSEGLSFWAASRRTRRCSCDNTNTRVQPCRTITFVTWVSSRVQPIRRYAYLDLARPTDIASSRVLPIRWHHVGCALSNSGENDRKAAGFRSNLYGDRVPYRHPHTRAVWMLWVLRTG